MDYPLIEIRTVPIELEMKITDAKLIAKKSTVDMQVTRKKGGLNIQSKPIRLNLDTFEARNSIFPTIATQIKQNADAGRQAVYDATATYARQGQLLLQARMGENLFSQFAEEAQNKNLKPNVGLQFLPTTGVNISWNKNEMVVRYEMDKLNFDWRKQNGDIEFIPGDIKISVTQQPDVLIKYVGGVIYVPPSADPSNDSTDA